MMKQLTQHARWQTPGENDGAPATKNGMPENVERKLSMQANERRRSMGNEDSEWLEAERVSSTLSHECNSHSRTPATIHNPHSTFVTSAGGWSLGPPVGGADPRCD